MSEQQPRVIPRPDVDDFVRFNPINGGWDGWCVTAGGQIVSLYPRDQFPEDSKPRARADWIGLKALLHEWLDGREDFGWNGAEWRHLHHMRDHERA